MMKSKQQIINEMCQYWRSDFNIEKSAGYLTEGMIPSQREDLQARMTEMLNTIIIPAFNQGE